jgi:hypothetical protein
MGTHGVVHFRKSSTRLFDQFVCQSTRARATSSAFAVRATTLSFGMSAGLRPLSRSSDLGELVKFQDRTPAFRSQSGSHSCPWVDFGRSTQEVVPRSL